jgi:hypothetical protein
MQDLERDALADLDVLGEVDLAHAALADQLDHAIATVDFRADQIRLGLGIELLRERGGGAFAHACSGRAAILILPAIHLVVVAIGGAAADRAGLADRRVRDVRDVVDRDLVALLHHAAELVGGRQRQRARADARHQLGAFGALAQDVLGEQLLQERRHPRAVGGRRVVREPRLQRHAHLVAVGVAIGLARRERLQANLVELDGHARCALARPHHFGVLRTREQILRLVFAGREQLASREQLPEHDRGRVHIAATVELFAARLLR